MKKTPNEILQEIINQPNEETFKPKKTTNFKTINYHKTAPAGRGKQLDITITTKQITPKKHSKGTPILKLYPVTIQLYKNPHQKILLCSGNQWIKLTQPEIEELHAAVIYSKALSLHKLPSFLYRNVARPQIRLQPHEVEAMRKIHRRTQKWLNPKLKHI